MTDLTFKTMRRYEHQLQAEDEAWRKTDPLGWYWERGLEALRRLQYKRKT